MYTLTNEQREVVAALDRRERFKVRTATGAKGELNMSEFETMSDFEAVSRRKALSMVRLVLENDFSPTSPKLKQYAVALKPVRNLIAEMHVCDRQPLKELCRTVQLAVFPDHPVIKDPGALLETIMVNCIELAFFALEASGNKFPFEEEVR